MSKQRGVGQFVSGGPVVVKPPLRTKTLGTKVSEEERAQQERAASERGLTFSE